MAQLPIEEFKKTRGTKEFRGLVASLGMDRANTIAKKHTEMRKKKQKKNKDSYYRGVLKGMNIVINIIVHDN